MHRSVIGLLAVAAVLFCGREGASDTCAYPGAAVLVERAPLVFSGEAIRAEVIDRGGVLIRRKSVSVRGPAEVVSFRVHVVWKGEVPPEIRIWNVIGPPGIGSVDFRMGEKYVVFAWPETGDSRWQAKTWLCTGSGHIRGWRNGVELGRPLHVYSVDRWWGEVDQ